MTAYRARFPLAPFAFALLVGALAGVARADDPKFTFDKKEEVKEVVWKASAQVGGYGSTGNAQTATLSGAIAISRNDGWNKIALDVLGAYSRTWSRQLNVVDSNNNGQIDSFELNAVNNRVETPGAANWLAKLRYDRFFTERNSGYVSAFFGQDFVVNKDIISGGQIGYSRLVLKSEMNELAAEAGYDLSYTRYSKPVDETLIHSIRLFVGYVLTLRKDTAINASVEAFINANDVDIGPKGDPNTHKTFGGASRVIGKLGVTTLIYKNISLKVGLTAKYDAAPAPVGITLPKDAMGNTINPVAGLPVLRFDTLDLIGEAAIVVTFL